MFKNKVDLLKKIDSNEKSIYLNKKLVKIIGSALYKSNPNDVDLVVYDNFTLNVLLSLKCDISEIHPIKVTKEQYENIENLQSFNNIAYSVSLDNNDDSIIFGKNYTNSKKLVFNNESLEFFNNKNYIKKLKKSLLNYYTK